MFASAGRLLHRGRWTLLVLSLAAAVLAAPFGMQLFGRMSAGGFEDPGADSALAARWDDAWYGGSTPDVVVLYRHPQVKVRDGRFRKAVHDSLRALPAQYVARLTTYWSTGSKELVSADEHATYALVTLKGVKRQAYAAIRDRLPVANLQVRVGGSVPLLEELNEQAAADLARAEAISAPVLLVLLVVVFGSLVAAGLPLLVGAFTVVGALVVLRLLSEVSEVSVFALNAVTMLGLGLAVDYSLFVLTAFRERIRDGLTAREALAGTMATAGRTVAFSGLTVATPLLGLLVFAQPFLRSIGLAAAVVVLVAMASALVVLPAALAVLGPRVNALRITPDLGTGLRVGSGTRRWPALYAVAVVAVLLALATPLLHVRFGDAGYRTLPVQAQSRQVAETIDRDFARNSMSAIDVHLLVERSFTERPAVPGPLGQGWTPISAVTAIDATDAKPLGERLRRLPGVTGVDLTGLSQANGALRLSVRYAYDPASAPAQQLVERIRTMAPEPNLRRVVVGGPPATQLDLVAGLRAGLPWLALVVCGVTFLLLLAAFGSVVLPIEALVVNALSIAASFGVIVWGFQDGHLARWLHFTPTGTLEPTVTVLMLAVVFGLSMDYELFLLSRVRAEWLRTGDNTLAVAVGSRRAGGVITSAAVLLLVVVGAFATAGLAVVKLLGVGMFVAIVLDATLVRLVLAPAVMRLLGRANWWLPWWLRWGASEPGVGRSGARPVVPEKPAPRVLLPVVRPPARAPVRPARPAAEPRPDRPTWERVTEGRTRVVRANPDGPGWTWAEVDT